MTNPLYHPSELPFGLPDFSAITTADIEEGLKKGIEEESEQWQSIAKNPQPATVNNTVAALDASGALLSRAEAVFFTLLSSVGGEELDALYEKFAPKLAEHADDFWLNEKLYARYQEVAALPGLDDETAWLVKQTVQDFERRGVKLDGQEQTKLRELNAKLAKLQAQVDAKITKQLESTGTVGEDLEELAGLTEAQLAEATSAGKKEGHAWKLGTLNYSQPPLIASLDNPKTRARALADSVQRGFGSNPEFDTRELILQVVHLRAERARLLGFSDHAALALEEQTVPSPTEANALLETVGRAAVERLEQEKSEYEAIAQQAGFELSAADWVYLEEKKRGEVLGMDPGKLSEYFELDSVINNGLFYAAGELYGLTFRPRTDLKGWVEDVRTWEVFDEGERPIGLFMADFYTRPGKGGGAWMSEIQAGCARTGTLPIITNDANFTKPPEGQPTLLTWDHVETCFHEFGHALHGLLSNTYYESTAGTEVPSDFVELPSQLNELWAYNPKVLANYAKHYESGEPLPQNVAERLAESKHFGQAFATLEYVQSALIDQYWHRAEEGLPTAAEEVEAFETGSLLSSGVDHPLVVPRYRSPYFAHTFAGGYDAGYYAYMWAEAMVGELEEWFAEQAQVEDGVSDGGLNRAAGQKLRDELLSRGNSRDPLASFVAVKGRLPEGEAVIRRRGLN